MSFRRRTGSLSVFGSVAISCTIVRVVLNSNKKARDEARAFSMINVKQSLGRLLIIVLDLFEVGIDHVIVFGLVAARGLGFRLGLAGLVHRLA